MADTKSLISELKELIETLQTTNKERFDNIEAKLDSLRGETSVKVARPRENKTTEASASSSTPGKCKYVGPRKGTCKRDAINDTDYCGEHPGGILPKKEKPSGEASAPVAFEKKELTDEYEQIIKPVSLKGIVLSVGQPQKAYFVLIGDKINKLSTAHINALKPYNIVQASAAEIEELKENVSELTANSIKSETEKGTVAIKPINTKTNVVVSLEQDDDDAMPVNIVRKAAVVKKAGAETSTPVPAPAPVPAKVKKPVSDDEEVEEVEAPKAKVVANVDSDTEDQEEVIEAPKPKPTKPARVIEPEPEDAEEEEESVKPEPVKVKKVVEEPKKTTTTTRRTVK